MRLSWGIHGCGWNCLLEISYIFLPAIFPLFCPYNQKWPQMNNFLYNLVVVFSLSVVPYEWRWELYLVESGFSVCIPHFYKLLIHDNIFRFLVSDDNNLSDIQNSLKCRKCIHSHCSMHIFQIHAVFVRISRSVLFLFIGFRINFQNLSNLKKRLEQKIRVQKLS